MNGSNIWINLNADDKVTPKLEKVKNATTEVANALSTVMNQTVTMASAFATSAKVSKEQMGAVQLATDVLTDKFNTLKDVASGLGISPKFMDQLSDSISKAEKLSSTLNRVKNFDARSDQIYKSTASGLVGAGQVGKSTEGRMKVIEKVGRDRRQADLEQAFNSPNGKVKYDEILKTHNLVDPYRQIKVDTSAMVANQAKYNAELVKTIEATEKLLETQARLGNGRGGIYDKYMGAGNKAIATIHKNIDEMAKSKSKLISDQMARWVDESNGVNKNLKSINNHVAVSNRKTADRLSKVREENWLLEQRRKLMNVPKTVKERTIGTPPVFGGSQKETGGGMFGNIIGTVKNLAGAYIGAQTISSLVRISDELTNIKARIALVNDEYNKVNNTKITSAALEKQIMEAANRSRASYFDTAEIVARIGMNAGGAFKSGGEVVAFAELMQKSFVVAGSKAEEMRSAMLQLSQGMASNRLQGDELRAIFESAPIFTKYIADYLNVSQGEVRELASEGKLSAEVIKNAFFNAGAEIEAKFKKMPYTFTQLWTIFKNKAFEAWEPLYERIRLFANGKDFQKMFTVLTRGVELLAQIGIKAVDLLDGGVTKLRENMWWITPILGGIIGVLTVLNVATLLAKTHQIALGAAAMWSSIQYQIALFKMAVAQYGLNAAIMMCPISWLIAAIVAVIAVIYLAVAAVNHWAGTNISATGLIVGFFVWMGSMIANVVIGLINVFLIFVEFLQNVFRHPIDTIVSLFGNLLIQIIDFCMSAIGGWDQFVTDMVNLFIDGINLLLDGWNWLVDKMGSLGKKMGLEKAAHFEARTSVVSDLGGWKKDIADGMDSFVSPDYKKTSKVEYLDAAQNAKGAYNATNDKVSEFTGGLDILKEFKSEDELLKYMKQMGFTNKTDFADYLNNAQNEHMGVGGDGNPDYTKYLSNMDKNLAKTADSFDDTEFMRSLGSREATNKFTTQEIKLTMNNTNNISKDADSNTFIGLLVEEIKRALMTSAESAYRG